MDLSDPMLLEALNRVARAMRHLKQAKRLGVNVKPEKPRIKECAQAIRSGDYARAIELADDLLRRYPVMSASGDPR